MYRCLTVCTALLLLLHEGISAQIQESSTAATSVSSNKKRSVTFRLDVSGIPASAAEFMTIGIRGNVAPLSWETSYPMKKTSNENIYEATIVFESANPPELEYKFLTGKDVWETSGNRSLLVTASKTILPVAQWNDGPEEKGEVESQKDLYNEIARMDSLMFAAYNEHDAEKLMTFFDTSLEFYHDTGGLTNYAQNEIASKDILSRNQHIRRELVKGSLEVFPIKDYGAIQIGSHRFCHEENGNTDCGTFKFLMIWQKKDDQWKVTRVVSYDH